LVASDCWAEATAACASCTDWRAVWQAVRASLDDADAPAVAPVETSVGVVVAEAAAHTCTDDASAWSAAASAASTARWPERTACWAADTPALDPAALDPAEVDPELDA